MTIFSDNPHDRRIERFMTAIPNCKRIYAVCKSLLSGRYSARQIEPKPTALFLSAVVKA